MNKYIIFNHHSLPCNSKKQVNEFIEICIKLSDEFNLLTILIDENIEKNWFRLELLKGYYFQDWFNENKKGKNKELIDLFIFIQTQYPNILENPTIFEVFYKEKSYTALETAIYYKTCVISFPSKQLWCENPLKVKINKICNEELIPTEDQIINIYSLEILNQIIPKLHSEIEIKSGEDILNQKRKFIIFCSKAKEQLNDWRKSETILKQVKESLNALNEFGRKWNEGFYKYYSDIFLKECGLNHKVSGESETVLNDENLKKERMFYLPNGDEEFFENHIKLTNGIRIHFFPDYKTKKIYIGYIGEHLKLK